MYGHPQWQVIDGSVLTGNLIYGVLHCKCIFLVKKQSPVGLFYPWIPCLINLSLSFLWPMWNKTDSKTFCYVCSDRKLTQKLYYPPWTETLTATTHGIFILKAKIWLSPDKPGLLDEVLCGADLTGLVSARFIFPLSTGVWSALSSARTPWCSRQSIKSISVSCSLGDSGWQPEWACSSPISSSPSSSSSCHCLLSLCNMSGLIEACQCSLAAQCSLLR